MNPGQIANDINTQFKDRWFTGELDERNVNELSDYNLYTRKLNLNNGKTPSFSTAY